MNIKPNTMRTRRINLKAVADKLNTFPIKRETPNDAKVIATDVAIINNKMTKLLGTALKDEIKILLKFDFFLSATSLEIFIKAEKMKESKRRVKTYMNIAQIDREKFVLKLYLRFSEDLDNEKSKPILIIGKIKSFGFENKSLKELLIISNVLEFFILKV